MKKLTILTTIIFVIVLFMCGCGATYNISYSNSEKYQIGNFTYHSSDIKYLDLNWMSGKVTLIESEEEELSVTENSESLVNGEKIHYFIDGNTLRIQFCKSRYIGNIDSRYKHITVEIPKNLNQVKVDGVSCDIISESLNANDIDLEAVSGDIRVTTIKTNDLNVETVSGNFNSEKIDAPIVKVEAVSGSIEIEEVNGTTLNCETVSGDVMVNNLKLLSLEVETVSGEILLSLIECNNSSLKTTSGDCTIELLNDLGLTITTKAELTSAKSMIKTGNSYKFGDGACACEFKTTAGEVEVK